MHRRRHVIGKGRLEAFSDGVLAVVITIMVLELKVPQGADFAALTPLGPTVAAYVLSFAYLGIYWVNHHHLIQAADGIDGRSMWANLHLLLWLSFTPLTTAWIGEHRADAIPTAIYGLNLLGAAIAYTALTAALVAANGTASTVARVARIDAKQIASLMLYALGIAAAFFAPSLSDAAYVAVALIWLVPDRRIERALREDDEREAL